jgi:hypothetical protein
MRPLLTAAAGRAEARLLPLTAESTKRHLASFFGKEITLPVPFVPHPGRIPKIGPFQLRSSGLVNLGTLAADPIDQPIDLAA